MCKGPVTPKYFGPSFRQGKANLKVSELKQGLEERDLDTSGTKSALQDRLRQASREEAIDPYTFLFETSDFGRRLSVLESNLDEYNSLLKNSIEKFDRKANKKEETLSRNS